MKRLVTLLSELAFIVGLVVIAYDVTSEWLGVLLIGIAVIGWREADRL